MGRILPIELKEFSAASLSGTPQNYGSALLNPAIKISVINSSDVDAYLNATATPVTFHMRIPAGSAITFDESTLFLKGGDQEYYLPRGAQLTLTQVTAAGTGNITTHVVTRDL